MYYSFLSNVSENESPPDSPKGLWVFELAIQNLLLLLLQYYFVIIRQLQLVSAGHNNLRNLRHFSVTSWKRRRKGRKRR
jgi:hypothetical protein